MTAGPTVLIADDRESVRVGVRALLEACGVSVVGEACDGSAAVALATKLRPDVVILDNDMPVMLGSQAGRLLKRFFPEVRIIAFSATIRSRPEWADAYVPKDCMNDIVEALEQLAPAV